MNNAEIVKGCIQVRDYIIYSYIVNTVHVQYR